MIIPVTRVQQRAESDKDDSDAAYGAALMYYAEVVLKIMTLGVVSAVEEGAERHRYSQTYKLARADGIGGWVHVLREVSAGPTSVHVINHAKEDTSALKVSVQSGGNDWQAQAVNAASEVLGAIDPPANPVPRKVNLLIWADYIVQIRNKTRAHGAPLTGTWSDICGPLRTSIDLVAQNYPGFLRPWAYLHRNLSQKYRVVLLGQETSAFDAYKTRKDPHVPDGVYVSYDGVLRKLDLIETDVDLTNFYFANGHFGSNTFECLSYEDGSRRDYPVDRYLLPPGELPPSETEAETELEARGNFHTNAPSKPKDYIRRPLLESNLLEELRKPDSHPVVTLIGPGGIGKTYLALAAISKLSESVGYDAVIWFSARDIDLLEQGAKHVKPEITTVKQVAEKYRAWMTPLHSKSGTDESYLKSDFANKSSPKLFVFDNFETMQEPMEMYLWIDTFIRLPNKVLITSRLRPFQADYSLEVKGMELDEFKSMVKAVDPATQINTDELFHASDGHPYIAKLLLADFERTNKQEQLSSVLSSRDGLLDALFDRTFESLSPGAQHLFLMLCTRRTVVPLLAMKAVVMNSTLSNQIDVPEAIEELRRCALIDVTEDSEQFEFVSVPTVATEFGKKKLQVSPHQIDVDHDLEQLRWFGTTNRKDVRLGFEPLVKRLYIRVADEMSHGTQLHEVEPMLEFIARQYPASWLYFASLLEEQGQTDAALNAVNHFLESEPSNLLAWREIERLAKKGNQPKARANALVKIAEVSDDKIKAASEAANTINKMLRANELAVDASYKKAICSRIEAILGGPVSAGKVSAADCSRLAWLYMATDDLEKALKTVTTGLKIDPECRHCLKLYNRLS